MIRKTFAIIYKKDGSSFLVQYKLKHSLPFTLTEMRKWLKEDKKISKVTFISKKKMETLLKLRNLTLKRRVQKN